MGGVLACLRGWRVGSVLVWVACELELRGCHASVDDMATRVTCLVCQRV